MASPGSFGAEAVSMMMLVISMRERPDGKMSRVSTKQHVHLPALLLNVAHEVTCVELEGCPQSVRMI